MLSTIIRKEILENITSYKFTIIITLAVVLILTSTFIMLRDFQLRMDNYEILRPAENEPVALIPPAPLSIFAKGLDENIGRSYEVEFGGQIVVGSKQQSVNTLFRLFTTPDLLYVVKVIMSLCALLFAFDRIAGEKRQGTLRLSLANAVSRPILVLGKWIGGYISLIIPFLLAMLIAALIITLSPSMDLSSGDWTRLALFFTASMIYMAVFFSLGLSISAATHRTSSALVLSLFFWTVLIFVIPNMGNILARQLVDIPSVQRLELQREHIWIKEVFERINQGKDGGEVLSNINRENDLLMQDYRRRFEQLVRISKNITRISPAAAFTFFATDIAGTGLNEEMKAKHDVLNYKNMIWNRESDSDGNLTGTFPFFSYQRISIADLLSGDTTVNLILLIIYNVIFFTVSYVGFLRYDIR